MVFQNITMMQVLESSGLHIKLFSETKRDQRFPVSHDFLAGLRWYSVFGSVVSNSDLRIRIENLEAVEWFLVQWF